MKIIVLIKQVPNTTDVKIDKKTGNLIREGLETIINPDDLHALEAAVKIKEEKGGKITALSMGPPQAVDALSEAIGMGADDAVLLSDRAFSGADTWATSFTLGKAIEKIGEYDLVICGRQAIDGDTAQIGPQVADYLNIPQVSYVYDIEDIREDEIIVKRSIEDGYERIACDLPGLITVIGELNEPRYSHMGRLISACAQKAPIKIWNAADIGVLTSEVGLEGSLTHVIKTFSPKTKREGEFLEGSKQEIVKKLVNKLENQGILTK
jgi:electron transfer flavoprotein beta subunit